MVVVDQSQQLLQQAQVYQQQIQGISAQKEAFNMQIMEISNAVEQLEKTKEKDVYKASGPLLIKESKESVKKDLEEKKELLNTRLKVLEKSEQKLKAKIDELRERLSKAGMGS